MTYKEILSDGQKKLKESGIEEADLDARLLLEHVCGTDRNYLLAHGDEDFSAFETGENGQDKKEEYFGLIRRRAEHIPLQHLTGLQCFMGLDFQVNGQVLIPRQDTEILVEEVLKELHDGMKILDLCTGSGCIICSILGYSNGCVGIGTDLSAKALEIALKNAKQLLAGRCAVLGMLGNDADDKISGAACGEDQRAAFIGEAKIGFVQSDLFERITGKYDVIVSNPPYIKTGVIPKLAPEVKEHDPVLALDGGEDGLDFYRRIIDEAPDHLNGGGKLYFEIGYDQADEVKKMMEQADFREITVIKDYAGLDRVVYGSHL